MFSEKRGERKKTRGIIMWAGLLAGATLLIPNPTGASGAEPLPRYSSDILDSLNATAIVGRNIANASLDTCQKPGQDLAALGYAPIQMWESASSWTTSVPSHPIGFNENPSFWTQGAVSVQNLDFILDGTRNGNRQSVNSPFAGNSRTMSGRRYSLWARVVNNQSITSHNTGISGTSSTWHNWGTNF
ncbi:MAG: hypothetical protein ACYTEQ_10490 [Planctomycetota bacterium]|jgi:hypothetical protein